MLWMRTTCAVLWAARSSAPADDQSVIAPTSPKTAATSAAANPNNRIRPGVPSRADPSAPLDRGSAVVTPFTAGLPDERSARPPTGGALAAPAVDGAAGAQLMSRLPLARRASRHPVPPPGYLPTSVRRPRVPEPAQNQGPPRPHQGRPAGGSPPP